MKKISLNALLVSTSGFLATASGVHAQSLPAPGQDDSGWRTALSLYLFSPVRNWGDSTIGGNTVSVDLRFDDLIENLDFVGAGRMETWNGDFGIIADVNYAALQKQSNLPGPGGLPYDIQIRQKWAAILGAYRVAQGTGGNGLPFTVDVQGGARWNSIKQTVQIGPLPTVGGNEDWIEPVIGLRGMWRLNDKWTTVASADLGGFGAGGNDLQTSVSVGFDYQPWDNTAITFGYRYFSVDYSTTLTGGTFAYDMQQHGPYVGVKFFF
ncbi:hypothetical protein SAMN05444000_11683 [Shimia gijangensis]|uniref:Outer membrane protein beta-barrel domain-containing protein n=1 Tax=Shimia gijangensis TaxID=1470563 RepID=A0A1M6NRI6_9RHOB|nr:hypothetical protein [Shimia gijangensis]SHJ98315.1 hypothetical protein SAMN05444000_11683 [Shimia gijangensis]